jgi:putative transcriptional regulator
MINSELKELVRERDAVLIGAVAASRVTRLTRDAQGRAVHTELDPETSRRELAAEHAEHVAKARARLRYTEEEFADLLGTSPRTVTAWERGRRVPTGAARVLIEIAAKNPKAVLAALA